MADWLYAVNDAGDRWGIEGGVRDYFRSAARDDWGLRTAFRQVATGDWMWAYATFPVKAVVGVGEVKSVYRDAEAQYRMEIDWFTQVNRHLADAPISLPQGRAVRSIRRVTASERAVLLRRLDETEQLALGRAGRVVVAARRVARPGQSRFREGLITAYGGQCAVTACVEVATLEAAHIEPYDGPVTDRLSNGLLLRSDIHLLFDAHLLWIDEDLRVRVHETVLDPRYRELDGRDLRLPPRTQDHPSIESLRAHRAKRAVR